MIRPPLTFTPITTLAQFRRSLERDSSALVAQAMRSDSWPDALALRAQATRMLTLLASMETTQEGHDVRLAEANKHAAVVLVIKTRIERMITAAQEAKAKS